MVRLAAANHTGIESSSMPVHSGDSYAVVMLDVRSLFLSKTQVFRLMSKFLGSCSSLGFVHFVISILSVAPAS
ncbi:hypothetical protein BO79DRAFT_80090 [Aspergillus costaricaensis CBS 115574]|uniref:Uncharacterized protein n=1 Tax=Aspergillus costaricaensis CBS 115574 TaxID=1448317 RepID=A0ACD1IM93_9EURO|nr:hypothetical protein BO79DRAFT_80090 [Aspergillus costaricaensis CBS 115574]RAK91238.1 hypothetical protein BO79DRAFT_80090 [Aspergillus costaricaensis CBS 115574]